MSLTRNHEFDQSRFRDTVSPQGETRGAEGVCGEARAGGGGKCVGRAAGRPRAGTAYT